MFRVAAERSEEEAMMRPLKRNGRAATSHPGGARFAAAWSCGLFVFVVGCTGTIGPMQSGAGGASNPSGSGGSGMGGGQTGGSAGPGMAGQGSSTGLGEIGRASCRERVL